ncbi:DNA translocase FtsK 4TM domain-containing protein, partial [Rhodococcus aerolatus]
MAGTAGTRGSTPPRARRSPGGSDTGRSRTAASGTRGSGTRGRSATPRTATTTRAPARPRRTARTVSTPQGPGPAGLAAGAVAGAVARGVGAGVRAVGRTREIEPGHRRDGLALVLLAAGVLLGAGVWAGAGGPVGAALDTGVRAVVGSGALALPVLLAGTAVALMRSEPHPDARPRLVLGSTLLVAGVLGLVHLAAGSPGTSTEWSRAGGAVGWVLGTPLSSAVTVALAAPLLLLVAVYGVLVLSGTTIREVPATIAGLLGWRRDGADELADGAQRPDDDWSRPLDEAPTTVLDAAEAPAPLRRPSRRRQARTATDVAA